MFAYLFLIIGIFEVAVQFFFFFIFLYKYL